MSKAQIPTVISSLLLCLLLASTAGAIAVNPMTDVGTLASALLGSNTGIVIRSSECRLEYCSNQSASSCGTYTNASGIYGAGPGVVLSTGDVSQCADYSGTDLSFSYNTLASDTTNALLTPITGSARHYDSTRLDIVFDLLPGYDGISIDAVFGSEEYPRWQNTPFNDGLGIYLNDVNIAFIGDSLLNISSSYVLAPVLIPGIGATGLDGVLAPQGVPLMSFAGSTGNGVPNRLTIVLGDASDSSFDTVAFIGNLRANQAVPEPASILSLGLMSGCTMLAILRRRLS